MKNPFLGPLAFFCAVILFSGGCATTRAKKPEPADLTNQVAVLQGQLAAKDQEIQDLKYQIDGFNRSLETLPAKNFKPAKGSIIHVPDVTPRDLQNALARAGFDPGPVDGRIGKKTKAAVKQFQRKKHLRADGLVGEKTWALLKG